MLTLEPPQFNIRGLTIFRDFSDPKQFYYLPRDRARVSENGKGLAFVVYTEDISTDPDFNLSEDRAGGFLTLEVELGPDPNELLQVESELASRAGVGQVNLAQVPFTDGTVTLYILSQTGAATGGVKGFEVSVAGSTKPSLFGRQTAVFSVRLGGKAANVLWETLRTTADPQAVVTYDLEFRAIQPSYNLEIEIDFKETFNYLRHRVGLNLLVASVDLDLMTQEMMNDGHITVREVDFTGKGNANTPVAGEGGILKIVRDLMSPTLFTTLPIPTPDYRALPDSATKALETGGGTKAFLTTGSAAATTARTPISAGTDLKMTHTPIAAGQTPGGAIDVSATVEPAAGVTVNAVKVSWRTHGGTFQDVVLTRGATTTGPTPVGPTPVGPTPVGGPSGTPVGPTPVGPTPVGPTPVGPTPVGPTPVGPTPVGPSPVGGGPSPTPGGPSPSPTGGGPSPSPGSGPSPSPTGGGPSPSPGSGPSPSPTGGGPSPSPSGPSPAPGGGPSPSPGGGPSPARPPASPSGAQPAFAHDEPTPTPVGAIGANTFSGKIPGQPSGTTIEYLIRAVGTKAGVAVTQNLPADGETTPLSFGVGAAASQGSGTQLKVPQTDGPLIGYSLRSIEMSQQIKRKFSLNRAEAISQRYHPSGALSANDIGPEFNAAQQITRVALGQGPFKILVIKVQAGFDFDQHHVKAATVHIQYGKNPLGPGALHDLTVLLNKDQQKGQVQFFADDQGTQEYTYWVEFTYDPDRVVGTAPGQGLKSQTFTGVTARSITVDLDLHSPLIPVKVQSGVLSFDNNLIKQVQVRVAPSATSEGRVIQLAKDLSGDSVLVVPLNPGNRSYHMQQKFFFQDGSTTVETPGMVDTNVIVNEPNDLIFKMIPQFADSTNLVKEVLVDAVYTHLNGKQERSTLHLTSQAPRNEFAILLAENDPKEWDAALRFVMTSGEPLEATSQHLRISEPLVTLTKAGFKIVTVALLDETLFASDPNLLGVKVALGQDVSDPALPTTSLLLRAAKTSGTVVVPGVLPTGAVSVAVEVLRRNQPAQRTTSTLAPSEKELYVTT